jgi:exodeoxyribonuclease VIII
MSLISSESLGNDFINQAKNHDPNGENILDVNDSWYFADNSLVTNTMLGKLKSGPQTLYSYMHHEDYNPEKPHNIYGRAFHCAQLEPDEFDKRYGVVDDTKIFQELINSGSKKPRGTNKYKEWLTEEREKLNGKQEVSVEDYNDMMRMQEAIYARSQCRDILANTKKEIVYKGNIEGIGVKCKADVVNPGHYGLDLKGIKEAPTPYMFTKLLYSYDWVRQCAFYHDILKVDSFWFLVVEKTYPYTIGLYEISSEKIKEGRDKYMDLLKQYDFYFNQEPEAIKNFLFMQSI